MKCFLYTSVLFGGGAERVLCELANNLSDNNEVTLVASYKLKTEYSVRDKIKKIYLDSNISSKNSLRQIFLLRKYIKKEKPDIIISFLPYPNFKMLISTLGLDIKKIISVRNDPKKEYSTILTKILAKILYFFTDGIVFQTEGAREYFSNKLKNKSKIIMNQVDERFFQEKHKFEKYYVATGRLNEQKNYPLMINAFSKFIKNNPNEKLFIYGDGLEKKKLEILIKNLNSEKNIFLMGSTTDVPKILSEAKCFIISSDYEGMPNGLLEAMAVGLPCIATDCPCGGPKAIIKNNENGLLVPVGNEKAIVLALEKIEKDKIFREKCSINAKLTAQNFLPKKIFKEWNEYINYILNN